WHLVAIERAAAGELPSLAGQAAIQRREHSRALPAGSRPDHVQTSLRTTDRNVQEIRLPSGPVTRARRSRHWRAQHEHHGIRFLALKGMHRAYAIANPGMAALPHDLDDARVLHDRAPQLLSHDSKRRDEEDVRIVQARIEKACQETQCELAFLRAPFAIGL